MIWWRQLYFQVTREGELLPFFQTELKVGGDGEEDKIFFIWPTTIVHKIDEKSPLYHISASDMLRERFEIIVMLEGNLIHRSRVPRWKSKIRSKSFFVRSPETNHFRIKYEQMIGVSRARISSKSKTKDMFVRTFSKNRFWKFVETILRFY